MSFQQHLPPLSRDQLSVEIMTTNQNPSSETDGEMWLKAF